MANFIPWNERTFETRLQFVQEIFSAVFPKNVILQSAIEFKLSTSFQQYEIELLKGINLLQTQEEVKLLKKLNTLYKESK